MGTDALDAGMSVGYLSNPDNEVFGTAGLVVGGAHVALGVANWVMAAVASDSGRNAGGRSVSSHLDTEGRLVEPASPLALRERLDLVSECVETLASVIQVHNLSGHGQPTQARLGGGRRSRARRLTAGGAGDLVTAGRRRTGGHQRERDQEQELYRKT